MVETTQLPTVTPSQLQKKNYLNLYTRQLHLSLNMLNNSDFDN